MTSTTFEHLRPISEDALDTLFRRGRTANTFTDEPVSMEQLREIYEIAKFGPTAANSQPLRIAFITSQEAKERLLPHIAEGNRAKTASAPVVALLAADADFNSRLPELFPHVPGAENWFGDLENRKRVSEFGAAMQTAYFITAIRALGLAAGPMNGFDAEAINQEFFPGTNRNTVVVVNIGHPGENAWFERLPRLSFEDAVDIH